MPLAILIAVSHLMQPAGERGVTTRKAGLFQIIRLVVAQVSRAAMTNHSQDPVN